MSDTDDPLWARILRGFFMGKAEDARLQGQGAHIDAGKSVYAQVPIAATGYDRAKDIQARIERMLSLQEEAIGSPAWQPRDGVTYCNRAAMFLAQNCGYFGFGCGLLANEMIAHMIVDPRWHQDSIDRAHKAALNGGLAFLTLEEHPHGHLAAVAPLPFEHSESWGVDVPILANVGKQNGFLKASGVFKMTDWHNVRAFILTESVA